MLVSRGVNSNYHLECRPSLKLDGKMKKKKNTVELP